MTEKAGLEKTVVFNLKSANESDVNNIVNEYDEEERSMIPYDNPKIVMITFSDIEFAKEILSDDRLPKGLYMDDFKHIRPFEEVIEKL